MRGFVFCLTDNTVQNGLWGKPWGKMNSERGLKYGPLVRLPNMKSCREMQPYLIGNSSQAFDQIGPCGRGSREKIDDLDGR
jgi:hypothetical protein